MFIHLLHLQSLSASAPKCIGNNIQVDDSNWESYVQKGVPVIIRMVFTGCIYAQPTQQVWTDAAKLYEDVLFLEADCINGAAKLCKKLQIDIGKKQQLTSPSHFFYKATGQPQESDLIKYAVEPQVEFFTQEIRIRFNKNPIGSPVRRLDTYSTSSFLNTTDASSILFYSSDDFKHIDFVSRPIDAVNSELLDSSLFSVGALDCCRYPEECKRWTGKENPGLMSLVYSKTTSRSLVSHKPTDDVEAYSKSILSASDLVMNVPNPQQTPYPVQPGHSQRPGFNEASVTIRSELQSRSKSEVMKMYKEYGGFEDLDPVKYNLNGERCKTGSYDEAARNKAFRGLNFFRKVAGVEPVKEQKEGLKSGLDALAVVLGRQGTVSHNTTDFECTNSASVQASVVIDYAKRSNLGLGAESPHKAVENLIRDWGASNSEVGHRYNMLHPSYNKSANSGFWIEGQRTSIDSNYFPGFSAILLESGNIKNDEPWYPNLPSFIAYPAPGPFPLQFGQLTERWSVQSPLLDGVEDTSNIEVKLVGSDNSAIEVIGLTLNKGYGKTYRLLSFEISRSHLQLFVDGFSVEVQVFFKSTKTELRYTVEFFDASLPEGESYCVYKSNSNLCPSSSKNIRVEDLSNSQFSGEVSLVSVDKSSQLNLPKGSYNVTIEGLFSSLTVPHNVSAKVLEAEDADVYIDYSPSQVPSFGKAEFIKPPRNIIVRFTSKPELSEPFVSSTIYQGPLSKVFFPSETVYEFPNGNLDFSFEFYSTTTVPNELNIKRYYTSYIARFCDNDLGTVYPDEQQLPRPFSSGGLLDVKLTKRIHTIQIRGAFNYEKSIHLIGPDRFPSGKYNYIFEVSNPADSIRVGYRYNANGKEMAEYDTKINSITFQNYNKDKQLLVGFYCVDSVSTVPRVFPMKFIFKNCYFIEKSIHSSERIIYLLDFEVDADQESNLRKNFFQYNNMRPTDCKYVINQQQFKHESMLIEKRCAIAGVVKMEIVYTEGNTDYTNNVVNVLPYDLESSDIKLDITITTESPVDIIIHGFNNLVWNVIDFPFKYTHNYRITSVRNIQFNYKTMPYQEDYSGIKYPGLTFDKGASTTQIGVSIADDPSYKVDMSSADVSVTDSLGKTPTITGVKAKSFTIENVEKCTLDNVEVKSIKTTGSNLEIKNSNLANTDITVEKDGFELPSIRAIGSSSPKSLNIYYSGQAGAFKYLDSSKLVYKAITDVDTDIQGWLDKATLVGVPESITQQKSQVGKDIVFELTFNEVEIPPIVTPDPNFSEEGLPSYDGGGSDGGSSDGDGNDGGSSDGDGNDGGSSDGGGNTDGNTDDNNSTSDGLSGGSVAAIVIVVLLAVGAASGSAFYFLYYKKRFTSDFRSQASMGTEDAPIESEDPSEGIDSNSMNV